MKLQIQLKSDLCTSSGENYNSYIDTDVVYDDYGFPYIPAKRLKGVLREAALELVDFGLYAKEDFEKLFGVEGDGNSLFAIDNAYLKHAEDYIQDIVSCADRKITHPQRVLGLYTYTRTQTAMTQEGIAKENSLRTFRVVNSGEEFVSQMNELEKLNDSQRQMLKDAARMVKHIGNSRTRGLGLVEMHVEEETTTDSSAVKDFTLWDKNIISYKINLKAPLLCKTSDGNQERTEEYIQGSKVLGILAGVLGNERFCKLMGHDGEKAEEFIISNAYICDGDHRCTPIAASYQKKKDQSFVDGEMQVKDMLSGYQDEEQWTPVGSGYLSTDGYVRGVETKINYHHKRPENKAIGRASGEDNSSFYQLRSICKNQSFVGYILADREQAQTVLEVLKGVKDIRIGNNKNTEYGRATIEVTDVKPCEKQTIASKQLLVKLNAATILYNEYGMPCAEANCLQTYLENTLGLAENSLQLKNCYVTYEEIGGFNVTWHRRKPYFTAWGKGSVFLFEYPKECNITVDEILFVGERVAEGYGEIALTDCVNEDVMIKRHMPSESENTDHFRTDIINRLLEAQHVIDLKEMARKEADERAGVLTKERELTATLGKLILLSKTVPELKDMMEQVEGIETDSKRKLAKKVLSFTEKYVSEYSAKAVYEIMLPEYLAQLKYKLRTVRKGEK